MAYSEEEREKILNTIFESIESGDSLRKCLVREKLSSRTFFQWIDKDEDKVKQYARSLEIRAEGLFDELLEVAYTTETGATTKVNSKGETETTEGDMLGHRRLKTDTLKWALSKMFPKKFGEKVDVTSGGDKIPQATAINIGIVKPLED